MTPWNCVNLRESSWLCVTSRYPLWFCVTLCDSVQLCIHQFYLTWLCMMIRDSLVIVWLCVTPCESVQLWVTPCDSALLFLFVFRSSGWLCLTILLSNSRLRTGSWLCFCKKWAEPPQPGGRASATEGRASATRTPTKLAEVDLCWLNLNFGLYYKLDSMKTWENCNRTLFLLPHLGKGQTPKEHVFVKLQA